MKTNYIYTIIVLLSITKGFSQNSLFFFKKDTVFITYDTIKINSNIKIKLEKIIDSKTKKRIGTSTIYNLLDSLEINRKIKQNEKIKNTPSIGLHGVGDIYFGIHFRHETVKDKIGAKKFKRKASIYKIFNKSFQDKTNKTLKDSIDFDKLKFYSMLRLFNRPNNQIKFKEIKLKDNRVIYFDGSKKVYDEIKRISKEPTYIYILDKIVLNKCDKKKYYHFNEVTLEPIPIIR